MKNKENRMSKRYLRNSEGFTLAELMLTVAIIIILAGFAFVAVSSHQRKLQKLEADNVAKEIYNAAQNQLTTARANGSWDGFLRASAGYKDLGAAENGVTNVSTTGSRTKNLSEATSSIKILGTTTSALVQNHDFRYIMVNDESDLGKYPVLDDYILPKFSIDGTVRTSGSYIIKYDVTSASIFKVWYSNKSNGGRALTADDVDCDTTEEQYGKRGNIVGSYGGLTEDVVAASTKKSSTLKPLQVEIINGENLVLKITDPNGKLYPNGDPEYYVKVYNENDESDIHDTQVFKIPKAGSDGKFTPGAGDTTVANSYQADYNGISGKQTKKNDVIVSTILLDSVSVKNGHFAQIFPKLAVGGNIDVEVKASVTIDKEKHTLIAGDTDNSFFADGSTKTTANILTRRHFENLSEEISTVSAIGKTNDPKFNITTAELRTDLDFKAIKDKAVDDYGYTLAPLYLFNSSWDSYNSDANFIGIVSRTLTKFDGNGHTLSNLNLIGEEGTSPQTAKYTGYTRRAGLFTGLLASDQIYIQNLVFDKQTQSVNSDKNGVEAAILVTRVDKDKKVEISNITFKTAPTVKATTGDQSPDSANGEVYEVHANAGVIAACVAQNATLKITDVHLPEGLTVGENTDNAASANGYTAGGLVGQVTGSVEIGNKTSSKADVTIGGAVHVYGRDNDLVKDDNYKKYYGAGVVIGSAYSATSNNQSVKLYHVSVNASSVDVSSAYAGGMTGAVHFPFTEAEISDCTLTAPTITINSNHIAAGGFAGNLSAKTLSVTNSNVKATTSLHITNDGANDHGAGGFIGEMLQRQAGDVAGTSVSISNCFVDGGATGFVHAKNTAGGINVGGFIGIFSPSGTTGNIENCYCSIPVSTTGGSAGGFAGDVLGDGEDTNPLYVSDITIKNCYAAGRTQNSVYSTQNFNVVKGANVSSWDWSAAGGFIGVIRREMKSLTIENCYTTASVKSTGSNKGTGGFIGAQRENGATPVVKNSYTTALTATTTSDACKTFIGDGSLAAGSTNVYVLAGINEASAYPANSGLHIASGEGSEYATVATIGTLGTPFEKGTITAVPYDNTLPKTYSYKGVAELAGVAAAVPTNTHVGDWPEMNKVIFRVRFFDEDGKTPYTYDPSIPQTQYPTYGEAALVPTVTTDPINKWIGSWSWKEDTDGDGKADRTVYYDPNTKNADEKYYTFHGETKQFLTGGSAPITTLDNVRAKMDVTVHYEKTEDRYVTLRYYVPDANEGQPHRGIIRENVEIQEGKIELPKPPSKEFPGHTFLGWFYDENSNGTRVDNTDNSLKEQLGKNVKQGTREIFAVYSEKQYYTIIVNFASGDSSTPAGITSRRIQELQHKKLGSNGTITLPAKAGSKPTTVYKKSKNGDVKEATDSSIAEIKSETGDDGTINYKLTVTADSDDKTGEDTYYDTEYVVVYEGVEVTYTVKHIFESTNKNKGDVIIGDGLSREEAVSAVANAGYNENNTSYTVTENVAAHVGDVPEVKDLVSDTILKGGFTAQPFNTIVVRGDPDLDIVEIHYKRNQYTLLYDLNGGMYTTEDGTTQGIIPSRLYSYGEPVILPSESKTKESNTVAKAGAALNEETPWKLQSESEHDDGSSSETSSMPPVKVNNEVISTTMPAQNVWAVANWVDNKNAHVRIEIYRQKATDRKDYSDDNKHYDFYTYTDTETSINDNIKANGLPVGSVELSKIMDLLPDLKSEVDDTSLPDVSVEQYDQSVAYTYEHFSLNKAITLSRNDLTVKADGTSVIKLYYDRNVVTFFFDGSSENVGELLEAVPLDTSVTVYKITVKQTGSWRTGYRYTYSDAVKTEIRPSSNGQLKYVRYKGWVWRQSLPKTEDATVHYISSSFEPYYSEKLAGTTSRDDITDYYLQNADIPATENARWLTVDGVSGLYAASTGWKWTGLYQEEFSNEGYTWNPEDDKNPGYYRWTPSKEGVNVTTDVLSVFDFPISTGVSPFEGDTIHFLCVGAIQDEKPKYYVYHVKEKTDSGRTAEQTITNSDFTLDKEHATNIIYMGNASHYYFDPLYPGYEPAGYVYLYEDGSVDENPNLNADSGISFPGRKGSGWNTQIAYIAFGLYKRSTYQIFLNNATDRSTGSALSSVSKLYLDKLTDDMIPYGDKVDVPASEDSDSIFEGWYDSIEGGTKIVNADGTLTADAKGVFSGQGDDSTACYMPYNNVQLFAHWSKPSYTVTFHLADETDTTYTAKVVKGTTLAEAIEKSSVDQHLERANYIFSGWAIKSEDDYQAVPTSMQITTNLDVYAQWKQTAGPTTYTIRCVDGGGNILKEITGNPGEIGELVSVDPPVLEGDYKDYMTLSKDPQKGILKGNDVFTFVYYKQENVWSYAVSYYGLFVNEKDPTDTVQLKLTPTKTVKSVDDSVLYTPPIMDGYTFKGYTLNHGDLKETETAVRINQPEDLATVVEIAMVYEPSTESTFLFTGNSKFYDGKPCEATIDTSGLDMEELEEKDVQLKITYTDKATDDPVDKPVNVGAYTAQAILVKEGKDGAAGSVYWRSDKVDVNIIKRAIIIESASYTWKVSGGDAGTTSDNDLDLPADDSSANATVYSNKKYIVRGTGFIKGDGATYVNHTTIQPGQDSVENYFQIEFKPGTDSSNYNVQRIYGTLRLTSDDLTEEQQAENAKWDAAEFKKSIEDHEIVEQEENVASTVSSTTDSEKDENASETLSDQNNDVAPGDTAGSTSPDGKTDETGNEAVTSDKKEDDTATDQSGGDG